MSSFWEKTRKKRKKNGLKSPAEKIGGRSILGMLTLKGAKKMNEEERLLILKKDLQRMSPANDDYLKILMKQAEELIRRRGITLENTIESDMAVIQYAAYLFRKRAGENTAMPMYLREQLNNMLISQKGRKT